MVNIIKSISMISLYVIFIGWKTLLFCPENIVGCTMYGTLASVRPPAHSTTFLLPLGANTHDRVTTRLIILMSLVKNKTKNNR